MLKRTLIFITISLASWAVFQLAPQRLIPQEIAGPLDTLMPVAHSSGLAWHVHAQEGESTEPQSRFSTGTFTRTLSIKLGQRLTDTTPISITSIVTQSDSVTADDPDSEPSVDAENLEPELSEPGSQAAEEPTESTETTDESSTTDDTATSPAADSVADDALPPGQADLSEENPVLGIVDGTILANRTQMTVKFFVEGQIYEVATLRSLGLDLPRASTVLNLYNCDAAIPETEEECYWDPYMVDRDGFYDIVLEDGTGSAGKVTLNEAGGPTGAAIWIQNRSPQAELVVYRNDTFDLLPGALREFTVGNDALPTFFVRSCLEVEGETACEWVPTVAMVGARYALVEVETVGGLPNSRVSLLDLLPLDENGEVIIAAPEENNGEPVEAEAPDEANPVPVQASESVGSPGAQMLCTLLVPVLNVRSGPGLQYEIIAKVRGTETEIGTVLIIGRDVTLEWLAVDEVVAPGGWITGSANFVACEGAISDLPEAEITDGRLAPVASVEAEAPVTDDESGQVDDASGVEGAEGEAAAVEEVPVEVVVPKGQALLNINNGFDQELRFTLDQKYRVQEGPSEYDLGPGDSIQIFVYPGLIGFSASTAWRGLSDNNDFFIEEEESRELWLFFMPDPDGSGRWILQY